LNEVTDAIQRALWGVECLQNFEIALRLASDNIEKAAAHVETHLSKVICLNSVSLEEVDLITNETYRDEKIGMSDWWDRKKWFGKRTEILSIDWTFMRNELGTSHVKRTVSKIM
jgi:hypothetical protein